MATGADKAAVLLSRLPPEIVEAVLGQLTPEQAGRLRVRLAEIQKTPQPPEMLEQTLLELRDLLRKSAPAKPEKKADGLADEFVPSAAAPPSPSPAAPVDDAVAELQKLDPSLLAAALRDERVATVALALSGLPSARVSEVLKLLPQDVRREAVLRIGPSADRNPALRTAVARGVVDKARRLASRPEGLDEDAQVKKLADLLRNLDGEDRKEILESLIAKDPTTAEKVKSLLYLFEDLLRIENRSLQSLLGEVDTKTLALALRGATEAIKQKVMSNLSTRARETLEEETSLLSTVPAAKTREAQASVVAVMQRLDKDGKLVMLD